MALQFSQEARAQQQADYNKQKDTLKFATDNGITKPFYMNPGSSIVYSTQNPGVGLTYEQYVQMGGQGKPGAAFPDVQTVQGAGPDYGSQYKEWQGYQAQGGKLSYPEYQDMDANRKKSVSNTTISDATGEFKLLLMQAPGSVPALKAKGYSWQGISELFISQGIDPGTPEIDDALHRAFQPQGEYENWKEVQSHIKRGAYIVSSTKDTKGNTVNLYSDGFKETIPK